MSDLRPLWFTARPMRTASLDLQAAIWFVAPHARAWHYATAEHVGVVVLEATGSRREISADELNRAYALMEDAEPGTIAATADAIRRGAFILSPWAVQS